MSYTYEFFLKEAELLVERSSNHNNFKWNLMKVDANPLISVKILIRQLIDIKYLKSYIFKEEEGNSFMIELDIIYSDVYQMPTIYFIINDINENRVINFEDYIEKTKIDINLDSVYKNFEISKTVK